MNYYRVRANLSGYYSCEAPNLYYGMGSGIDDYEVPTNCDADCRVSAKSEVAAKRLVERYHFKSIDFCLECIQIIGVEKIGEDADDDINEEVYDISYDGRA